MTNYAFPPTAAARTRTLATLGSPFAVPMAADSWLRNHNSIAATMRSAVPTVVDHGAAKQAAPPRGVPR